MFLGINGRVSHFFFLSSLPSIIEFRSKELVIFPDSDSNELENWFVNHTQSFLDCCSSWVHYSLSSTYSGN